MTITTIKIIRLIMLNIVSTILADNVSLTCDTNKPAIHKNESNVTKLTQTTVGHCVAQLMQNVYII